VRGELQVLPAGFSPVLVELDGQGIGRLPWPGAPQEVRGPAHASKRTGRHPLARRSKAAWVGQRCPRCRASNSRARCELFIQREAFPGSG
jgi:hypothetical protein